MDLKVTAEKQAVLTFDDRLVSLRLTADFPTGWSDSLLATAVYLAGVSSLTLATSAGTALIFPRTVEHAPTSGWRVFVGYFDNGTDTPQAADGLLLAVRSYLNEHAVKGCEKVAWEVQRFAAG